VPLLLKALSRPRGGKARAFWLPATRGRFLCAPLATTHTLRPRPDRRPCGCSARAAARGRSHCARRLRLRRTACCSPSQRRSARRTSAVPGARGWWRGGGTGGWESSPILCMARSVSCSQVSGGLGGLPRRRPARTRRRRSASSPRLAAAWRVALHLVLSLAHPALAARLAAGGLCLPTPDLVCTTLCCCWASWLLRHKLTRIAPAQSLHGVRTPPLPPPALLRMSQLAARAQARRAPLRPRHARAGRARPDAAAAARRSSIRSRRHVATLRARRSYTLRRYLGSSCCRRLSSAFQLGGSARPRASPCARAPACAAACLSAAACFSGAPGGTREALFLSAWHALSRSHHPRTVRRRRYGQLHTGKLRTDEAIRTV